MRKETELHFFSHLPTLTTERLFLRPLRADDAADMFEYAKNSAVTEFLLWSPHPDVGYTRRYLEFLSARYRTGLCHEWAVVERASGKMIGTCGFAQLDLPHNVGEIGYVLNPAFRGRGLAAEAATAVLQVGFETLGLHRIEARYIRGNAASVRVMEKIGMQKEGIHRGAMLIKGAYRDIGYAALTKEDWEARKNKSRL